MKGGLRYIKQQRHVAKQLLRRNSIKDFLRVIKAQIKTAVGVVQNVSVPLTLCFQPLSSAVWSHSNVKSEWFQRDAPTAHWPIIGQPIIGA